MFCKKCGAELTKGSKFCKNCGTKIEIYKNPDSKINSDQQQNPQASNKTTNSRSVVLIGKVVILIALICFFFTFMSVSCAGETRKISGTDMIFGDNSVTDSLDEEGYDSHSSLFNIFVCLSAISGVIAIIVKREKSAVLASLSAIFLLIFRFSAKHYYQINDMSLKDWEDMNLETHFGFALYLAIFLFFLGAGIIESTALDENENKTSPLNNTSALTARSECIANNSVQSEKSEKQQD